jgi:DNA-binding transcriptional MerR regulator
MTREDDERPSARPQAAFAGASASANASVIHVDFARREVRRETPAPPPAASFAGNGARGIEDAPEAPQPVDPVARTFAEDDVVKLLGFSVRRLRALDRSQVVSPSGLEGGRRVYRFPDLIALRAARDLLAAGHSLATVTAMVARLRQTLPRVVRPLHELRVRSDGRSLVVHDEETGPFEPLTGQLVMDFSVRAMGDDIVRLFEPARSHGSRALAFELYQQALRIDEQAERFDEAEQLYTRALQLDPALAIAFTNLGNVRYRRGDHAGAEVLYRRALACESDQPEAQYNLGYLLLERGDAASSLHHFERALEADPRFADAWFNRALALEHLGRAREARPSWERYLDLEPRGPWANVARRYLDASAPK